MAATTRTVDPTLARSVDDVRAAYLGLSVATIGWASAFILGKQVLLELTPLVLAGWRYVAATAMLLPFALRTRGVALPRPVPEVIGEATAAQLASARSTPRTWSERPPYAGPARVVLPLGIMVIAGGVLYPWLFLGALGRTTATNTSLLVALNPVLTLLLSPFVGERLDRRRLVGAGLAFAGAVYVICRGDLQALLRLELNAGDLLAVAAAGCWATFNLASRPVVGRVAPSIANLAVYGGGAIALLALGWSQDPIAQIRAASPLAIANLLAMALLSSVVAGQLFLVGVRRAGVGRAVVFIYMVPVLTALLASVWLDEPFSVAQAIGGTAVLAGLYLATSGAPGH